MDDELRIDDRYDPADRAFLGSRVSEFNLEATGIHDGRGLSGFVRDADGSIIAGVMGSTWGGFCEIELLWVRADHRGRGFGTGLLHVAEDEARRRGATQVGLDTYSFQAPDLYLREGYRIVGAYEDYPVGHRKIFMVKSL